MYNHITKPEHAKAAQYIAPRQIWKSKHPNKVPKDERTVVIKNVTVHHITFSDFEGSVSRLQTMDKDSFLYAYSRHF